MKYYSIILFLLATIQFSCFDDKSSLADHPIPDIVIDTTGIPKQFSVYQYGRLQIAPKVSLDNGDRSAFSYRWMLNTIATTTQSETASYSNYICIGEDETLDTIISLASNETTYFLWYQVQDTITKLRKDILWTVLVRPAYNEGILIAETSDGITTDLSLIEGEQFTEGWTEDDKITRNLYSQVNGENYPGLIKQICHSYNSSTKSKRFYCLGDDFYALIDGSDYQLAGIDYDVIYDYTLNIKPSQIFVVSGYVVWVNDGKIYPFSRSSRRDYPNIQIPMGYSIQEGGLSIMKTAEVDQFVAYAHATSSSTPWGVWYDKQAGRFLCQTNYPYVKSNISTLTSQDNTPFDPNNVPGLKTLYAALGVNDDFYMIMENIEKGTFHVYVISRTNKTAKYLYNIPGNEIKNAEYFTVSEDGNVVYFSTKTQVYSIVLGGATPQVNLLYTIPAGEITHFSMFRQAWYLLNPSTYVSGVGYKIPIDTHEHLLLVGVWDGNNGSLHTLPIINPSIGNINLSQMKKYEGFGKILTVTSQQ